MDLKEGDSYFIKWFSNSGEGLIIRQRALCSVQKHPEQLIFFNNKKWLVIELNCFIKQIHYISYGIG